MAPHYLPLTERILPRGIWRWIVIAVWAVLPLASIPLFALFGSAGGSALDVHTLVSQHLAGMLLNS